MAQVEGLLLSRRRWLSAELRTKTLPLRPPWALPESLFDQRCTACSDCIDACPTGILFTGTGHLPEVDFSRGECLFCGDCAAICKAAAFDDQASSPPWALTPTIANSCLAINRITCRSCSDVCEPDAISFRLEVGGKATPEVHLDDCTGCGACVAPCPANAIQLLAQASPLPTNRSISR